MASGVMASLTRASSAMCRSVAVHRHPRLTSSRWRIEFPSSVAGDQLKSLFKSSLRASFPARLAAAVVSK